MARRFFWREAGGFAARRGGVFRDRRFALFWTGQMASTVGDYFLLVALPFYAYSRTGSALASGIAFLSEYFPAVALGLVAGVLVDRWDRRSVMIASDVGRALILVGLIAQPHAPLVWTVYAVALAKASLSQLFGPTQTASFPRLIGPSELTRANAAMAAGGEISRLVGPALGGVAYALGEVKLAAGLDGASYVISAATLILLPVLAGPPERAPSSPSPITAFLEELRQGLDHSMRVPALRSLLISTAILSCGGGMLPTVWVPFARTHLHATGAEYGLALSAQAVGGLAGAATVGRVTSRWAGPRIPLGASMALIGVVVAFLAVSPDWESPALILAIGGAPTTIEQVVAARVFQTVPPDALRGRVAGVCGLLTSGGVVLGLLGAGALVAIVGVVPAMLLCALVLVAAGATALLTYPRATS